MSRSKWAMVVVAVCLVVTVAAVVYAAGQANPAVGGWQVMNSPRYQVYYSPNMRADTFLLDTQTGTVWKLVHEHEVIAGEGEQTLWQRMRKD